MITTTQKISQKLDELEQLGSPAAIAARLLELGCKRVVDVDRTYASKTCPIYEYLKKSVDRCPDISVTQSYVAVPATDDAQGGCVDTPELVHEFIRQMDQGEFPQLGSSINDWRNELMNLMGEKSRNRSIASMS